MKNDEQMIDKEKQTKTKESGEESLIELHIKKISREK